MGHRKEASVAKETSAAVKIELRQRGGGWYHGENETVLRPQWWSPLNHYKYTPRTDRIQYHIISTLEYRNQVTEHRIIKLVIKDPFVMTHHVNRKD